MNSSNIDTARKYVVDDLPGASIPGSRITKLLQQIEAGSSLSNFSLEYLKKNNFLALFQYASKKVTYEEFLTLAEPEKSNRCKVEEEKASLEQIIQQEQRNTFLAKAERKNERFFKKKRTQQKRNELKSRYGLFDYIEEEHFPRIMNILRCLDTGKRIKEKDVIWLTTNDYEFGYFTEEIKEQYHSIEADFYRAEYKKRKDPWLAVNASSHYRKSFRSKESDSMLTDINIQKIKNKKLKSALCTTHGGVKRDLHSYDNAVTLAEKAHQLTPNDFRPCALLGAIYMETGNHSLGDKWYQKAVNRGASEGAIDNEVRSIFNRMPSAERNKLRTHLLKKDPQRYRWAKKS